MFSAIAVPAGENRVGPRGSILRQELAHAGPLRRHPGNAQIHSFEYLRQVSGGAIVLIHQRGEIVPQLFARFSIAETSANARQDCTETVTKNARLVLHDLVKVRFHKLEGMLSRNR